MLPLVFNTRDEKLHTQLKKPIAPLFSLSNVLAFEPLIDKTIAELFLQLDNRFVNGSQTSFDLSNWLQFFAFEVMGTMTFGRMYGFLSQGCDTNGLLISIWNYMKTAAPVSITHTRRILAYETPLIGAPF